MNDNLKNPIYKTAREYLKSGMGVRIHTKQDEVMEWSGQPATFENLEGLKALFIERYPDITGIEPINGTDTERNDNMKKTNKVVQDVAEEIKGELDRIMTKAEESVANEEIKAITKEMNKKIAKSKKAKKLTQGQIMAGGQIRLTPMQVAFIKHLPEDSFYENGVDSIIWSDIYCENLESAQIMGRMSAGGIITTLVQKGILITGVNSRDNKKRQDKFFEFTEFGKKIAAELGL